MSEFLTPDSKNWESLQTLMNYLHPAFGELGKSPYDSVNREVISFINKIKKEELKISIEDYKVFWSDVRTYVNTGASNRWFTEHFDERLSDSQIKNIIDKKENEEVVARLLVGLKYWRVEGDRIVLSSDRTSFKNENSQTIITEKIVELIDNGDFDKIVTKLIGQIIQDGYRFFELEKAVAKRINDRIRDVDTSYGGGGLSFLYDYYIGFKRDVDSTGTTGVYRLSENIYADEPTTIPLGLLSPQERTSFEFPAAVVYPDAIITDYKGDIIESAKEELRNFDELLDSKISEYPFVYQKDEFPSSSWLLSMVSLDFDVTRTVSSWSFTNVFTSFIDSRKTPNQVIKENVLFLYQQFISSVILDKENGGQLELTIGEHFSNVVNADNFANNQIFELIYFEKIIASKKELFDRLAKAAEEGGEGEGIITPEEREEAYAGQLQTFQTGRGGDIEEPPSEEDLENRQKYFKQCALMLNMATLRDTYQQKLFEQYRDKVPYHGRFMTLRANDGDQETMLSSLVSSAQEQTLFELETHKVTRLVPKIRLFKVFNDPKHGEKEIEFIFDRTSSLRPTFMDDGVFDKGTGVGLKNFSFEFNGTNPAEARNDIKANLTIFFQSFQDFVRERTGYKTEDKYRYVDLVIQPKPDDAGKVGGIEIQSDRQYEPQFYRIRAEVGYVVPTEDEGFTQEEIKAIRVSNKSFFLNMVDHDISFGKDGTVEIKISYRAYLESLLKHPRLDALASPELIAKRVENARTLTEQLNKRECSVEQIKELQVSLAAQEGVLIKQSLSSIIKRLRSRKVIYTVLIKEADKKFFLRKGFFNKCDLETGIVEDGSDGADVKLVLNSDLPESSDDFDFIDSGNRSVQFFYFGDLLYTILDCVYESEGKVRKGAGFDRNSIILGSFEFEPFQTNDAGTNVYNIADIPISVDFFSRWFVDNVVSQKSTRKTFPVLNFIRSLSNYLIKPSLIENCVNRKLETRLRFQTAQVSAYKEGGANPLLDSYKLSPDAEGNYRDKVALDVSPLRTSGLLPFDGGPDNDANSNFKDYHTFIVLNALGSTLSYSGLGDYVDDIEKGRFHVHVGQNAGLVKTLSLSKSDQQYIREARFFQNGIDGLLQLSAVYVANIEMFGNTLFYPGMEIFFNPYGIGGEGFDPRQQGSIANRLGFGGYHTITSVKSSISPGKFTTSISAQQYYSGDGTGNPNIVKKRNADKEGETIEGYTPVRPDNEQDYANCKQVILNAQNYAFEEGTIAGRISGASSNSIEEATNEDLRESPVEVPVGSEPLDDPFGTSDNTLGDTNEELGESDNVSIVTADSLNESPTVVRSYTGKLRTMISSQSTTSSTGGQLVRQYTEQGGTFTEMSDGTVYFQAIGSNGPGPKIIVTDHSRIIR